MRVFPHSAEANSYNNKIIIIYNIISGRYSDSVLLFASSLIYDVSNVKTEYRLHKKLACI